jgi:hypothetical protein
MTVRGFTPGSNGTVPSSLLDQLELSYLSGLQDQRSVLARTREMQRQGMGLFSGAPSKPGTATADGEEDLGITNRSPRISKRIINEKGKSDAPWIALIIFLLILSLFGILAWWTTYGPKPPVPAPQPTNPAQGVQVPGNYSISGGPFSP